MRRGVLAAGLVLLAAPVFSCSGSKQIACEDPAAVTAVQIADNSYSPGCVQTSAGSTLTIQNQGKAPHTFTVRGTGLEAKTDPGAIAELAVADVIPGTYEVFCVLHPDMRGALKIV